MVATEHQILQYIQDHQSQYLDQLFDLLRIPSISANSQYQNDVLQAADYLKSEFQQLGMDNVELLSTGGYPVVFAEKHISDDRPTVLIYGHYDVQPPDPLDLWQTSPFEPEIREGQIYARGACDDKGQMFMHVKAVDALINNGGLPCNVKFFIEGEEEVGSAHLADCIRENADKLTADAVILSDTSMIANDLPSITVGLRGMAYMEVKVKGPNRDLHSGTYGGPVANPCNVLASMIHSLHDENGHITIPGFYDKVRALTEEERDELNKKPFNEEAYKKELGLSALNGEKGFSPVEQTTIRPTLDVNGIWGGYTGEGAKTILPAEANAKISMRLVPDQEPEEVAELFRQHFQALAPATVSVEVAELHGGNPFLTNTDSKAYKAAEQAYETTFGKTPIASREGGSIPITKHFKDIIGAPVVLMGFGLDSDAIHSPNEHFGVFNFQRGIETISLFHRYFAEMQ
jgi:acetylornithine deacetylase/succinyl-diaminopimelate desuccinylase-like protein